MDEIISIDNKNELETSDAKYGLVELSKGMLL